MFWFYTSVINKDFFPGLQRKLVDFVNDFIKKINPIQDNIFNDNIPLMKSNLYMMTFNKNIDLYNNLYNSNNYSFIFPTENLRNLEFDDLKLLIPTEISITSDMVVKQLDKTKVTNTGFSKFFLELSNKGLYLLDYWDLFYGLMQPLLIINYNNFTDEMKIDKLNVLHNDFITYDAALLNNIKTNMNSILDVIYGSILILSDITINYKKIVDLNDKFNDPASNMSFNDYNAQKNAILKLFTDIKTSLDTYLTRTGFQYSYIDDYINSVLISTDTFVALQKTTNYIIIYKMFNSINFFTLFYQYIDENIFLEIKQTPI